MTRTQLDIATSPRRIFTLEEANGLLPAVEEVFASMDATASRARELADLLGDMEAYWGKEVERPHHPEHEAYETLRTQQAEALRELNDAAIRLSALGCELKDTNRGLVDFYAYVNGDLVYLCWQRGEDAIRFWHTLEAGFAGRRPLP